MPRSIICTGQLHASSYGILLLPPENSRLFVNAGWTKADIRRAVCERTRRSIAWVKSSGYKVRFLIAPLRSMPATDGYIEEALRSSRIAEPRQIRLIYPSDSAGTR